LFAHNANEMETMARRGVHYGADESRDRFGGGRAFGRLGAAPWGISSKTGFCLPHRVSPIRLDGLTVQPGGYTCFTGAANVRFILLFSKEFPMKRWLSSSVAVRLIALSLVSVLILGSAIAQEAAQEKQAKAKGKPRLPTHYAKVVDPEQREKIIGIREEFAAKKEELQKQLDAINAEEMTAIEAVLTPEQKQKLAALQAEAKASREKKAAERKAGAEKGEGAKPAPKAAKKAA
jgi:hypothetical protein